ncbi:MAG: alpha/beta hydrolase [Alphaproteobacteria bacterium]|nr:alpha/beta hydrolase [Alphaproteobacteria bacterium SS10]
MASLFEGFESAFQQVGDVTLHYRRAGSGPPLVLLHGYPETHVMWHKIAPILAEDFTVILPDLRGYGDSDKPAGGPKNGDPSHLFYAKRQMAADIVGLMDALDIGRFDLVGHDRGARVAHRLCLDHTDRVRRVAFLDIVPTHAIFTGTDQAIATGFYHWFFLIQPSPLPETMIGRDPAWWLRAKLAAWAESFDSFDPAAVAEYERCFADPAAIHASCEDYRAGATSDLEHDAADFGQNLVTCPALVLWGQGFIGKRFEVMPLWQRYATDLRGQALNCGHFLPEEAPTDTLLSLKQFLTSSNP